MIAAILTIVVAMLVYIFWFIRMEMSKLSARIDESAIGVARMNKEMMGSVMKILTQPLLPDLEEEDDEDDEEEDETEGGNDGENDGENEEENIQFEDEDRGVEKKPIEPLSDLQEEVEEISTESSEVVIPVPLPQKRGRKKATEKNSGETVV
jgi:cobalamin biosynthesis protein CobT